MDLLTEIGDPCRFTSEGQFARWCAAAPIAVSSGEGDGPPRRHRLDLGGNRAVNSILHTVHVTQVRCHRQRRPTWPDKPSATSPSGQPVAATNVTSPT
jgi:hypothetical protein